MNTTQESVGALFLDLEETVIDDWSSRILLPSVLDYIRDCIEVRNRAIRTSIEAGVPPHLRLIPFTCLGLFSYAISHEDDLRTFRKELEGPLERALGLYFYPDYCLTVEKIGQLFIKAENIQINYKDVTDFRNFCGNKARTFFSVLPFIMPDDNWQAYLVDDTVGDMDLKMTRTNRRMHTRSIVPDTTVTHSPGAVIIGSQQLNTMLL